MTRRSQSKGPYCAGNMRALVGLLLQPGADPAELARQRRHTPATVATLAARAPAAADLALATDVRIPAPDELRQMTAALDDARARLAVLRAAFAAMDEAGGKAAIEAVKARPHMVRTFAGIITSWCPIPEEIISEELHLLGEPESLPPPPPQTEDPAPCPKARRGPRPSVSDDQLDAAIRALGHEPLPGYRKILEDLAAQGIMASPLRVRQAINRLRPASGHQKP